MKKPINIEVRSLLSSRNLEPYVTLHLIYDDKTEDQITQWTPSEAYNHAMNVLGCVEGANCDAFLISFLTSQGMKVEEATAVLIPFRQWRTRRLPPEKKQ